MNVLSRRKNQPPRGLSRSIATSLVHATTPGGHESVISGDLAPQEGAVYVLEIVCNFEMSQGLTLFAMKCRVGSDRLWD